jgi:hypothetical protein
MSTKIGIPSKPRSDTRSNFIQTEQSSHEAWARLTLEAPKSAALLHMLCSRMDRNCNAVVASWEVLSKLMGCHSRTVQRNMAVLRKEKWVQVVSLGKGAVNAFVLNSTVAWGTSRDNLKFASFTAHIIADEAIQDSSTLNDKLRKIPVLFTGDEQLPVGESEPPPSQSHLDGMLPDLPAIEGDAHLQENLKLK